MKAGDTVKAGGTSVGVIQWVAGSMAKVELPGGTSITLPASYLTVVEAAV